MWELDQGPGSIRGGKDSWALAQKWTPPDMPLAVFFFWNKDHSVKRKIVSVGFFPSGMYPVYIACSSEN